MSSSRLFNRERRASLRGALPGRFLRPEERGKIGAAALVLCECFRCTLEVQGKGFEAAGHLAPQAAML